MARDLEEGSYYVSHGGKIPVKWTAPEVIIIIIHSFTCIHTHVHTHCFSGSPLQEVLDSQ